MAKAQPGSSNTSKSAKSAASTKAKAPAAKKSAASASSTAKVEAKKTTTKTSQATSRVASALAAKSAATKSKLNNTKPIAEAEQMTLQDSPHDYVRPTAAVVAPVVTEQDRQMMVQNAAYHIAERDGFQSGREQEYWFQAEREVAEQLRAQNREQSRSDQPKPHADLPNDIH